MPSIRNIAEKTAIIDALLAKYDRSNSTGRIWRFSDTGYEGMDGYCRLKRVLHFNQVPEQVDMTTKMTFIRGHLTELMMESVVRLIHPGMVMHPFDHAPLRYDSPLGWSVQGRPDGLIWPNTVVEFKSINVDAKLDKPHESHECQVMLTMFVLDQELSKLSVEPFIRSIYGMSTGKIYYDKAGREFNVEPFIVERDDRVEAMLEELQYLHDHYGTSSFNPSLNAIAGTELEPERREKPDKFPCHWITKRGEGFCGYYHLCWGDRPEPVHRQRAPRRRRTA